jgi:hypothetical protein
MAALGEKPMTVDRMESGVDGTRWLAWSHLGQHLLRVSDHLQLKVCSGTTYCATRQIR